MKCILIWFSIFLLPCSVLAQGWEWQNPLPQGNTLYAVSFTDANTGTAVGGAGTILRTTNGGASWTAQSSGTTNFLRGVSFTDANTGTFSNLARNSEWPWSMYPSIEPSGSGFFPGDGGFEKTRFFSQENSFNNRIVRCSIRVGNHHFLIYQDLVEFNHSFGENPTTWVCRVNAKSGSRKAWFFRAEGLRRIPEACSLRRPFQNP